MAIRNKINARARWYAAYETALVARLPKLAGKLDWNTAAHLYNQGTYTPEQAAERHATTLLTTSPDLEK